MVGPGEPIRESAAHRAGRICGEDRRPRNDPERDKMVLDEMRSAVIDLFRIIELGMTISPRIMPDAQELQERFAGLRTSVERLKHL